MELLENTVFLFKDETEWSLNLGRMILQTIYSLKLEQRARNLMEPRKHILGMKEEDWEWRAFTKTETLSTKTTQLTQKGTRS